MPQLRSFTTLEMSSGKSVVVAKHGEKRGENICI